MSLPNPRLPLDTVEDMFDKLIFEESRLVDSWSVYDSFNFIVTAHHLWHDWVDKIGSPQQKARAAALPGSAETILQALRDVSNGSKHSLIDHKGSLKRQVVSEVTTPTNIGWDSYFFGDMVFLRIGDHVVSMSEFSALVVGYLEWIIHGTAAKSIDEVAAAFDAMKAVP